MEKISEMRKPQKSLCLNEHFQRSELQKSNLFTLLEIWRFVQGTIRKKTFTNTTYPNIADPKVTNNLTYSNITYPNIA